MGREHNSGFDKVVAPSLSLRSLPGQGGDFDFDSFLSLSAGARGFSLLELVVVMSIITILLAIAIPMYNHSIQVAREKQLRSELRLLNSLIVEYTLDKQKAPQSLDDLKTAGYIERVPIDPMTREPNWEVEQDEVLLTIEQQDPGITGVHSASNAMGSNGEPYSSW